MTRVQTTRKCVTFFFALMGALLYLSCGALAQEEIGKLIRVAYPVQPGLTEFDQTGQYSGYTYEYLEEIAQYTGWRYEFVQLPGDMNETLLTMMEMVEDGRLDLIGGMIYDKNLARKIDYISQSYGTVFTVLNVLSDNTRINENNFQSMQGLRVGVIQGAETRQSELKNFCTMNRITYTMVPFKDDKIMMEALREGRLDAILSVSVDIMEGTRTIAKFSPRPFYFATTKGNTAIVQQMNSAILNIDQVDPYFSASLQEKYFNKQQQHLLLTDDDQKFIEQTEKLQVGIVLDTAPFQYWDDKTKQPKGITVDLLRYIETKTGLKFELTIAGSHEELDNLGQSGKFDILAGISYDYSQAHEKGVSLTRPYASSQYIMMYNQNVRGDNVVGKRLALPMWFTFDGQYGGHVMLYNSVEECFEAVRRGDADYTYANGYTIQYYINDPKYKSVRIIPQTYSTFEICFGVVATKNRPQMLGLLNKTILSIPQGDLQSIIYNNTTYRQDATLLSVIQANPTESMLVVVSAACVVIGLLGVFLRSRIRLNRKISLEVTKLRQVYELANERFFEYDYQTNRFMVSTENQETGNHLTIYDYDKLQEAEGIQENAEYDQFMQIICSGEDGINEGRFKMPEGDCHWLRITTRTVRNELGQPVYTIGKILQIDDEKRKQERLQEEARKDGLTGIYNLKFGRQMVEEGLEELQEGEESALFLLDVDYFKNVNDSYGHFAGDEVLKQVANELQNAFRPEDIVSRIGGDEFIAYMHNVPSRKVLEDRCAFLINRMRSIPLPKGGGHVTVSIGVTLAHKGSDYDTLYQQADKALYDTKNQNRDGYQIFQQ